MIRVKTELEFKVYNFTINYFENQTITDFEYLVILLVNDAIDNDVDLSEEINVFTKGDNDVKMLIEKRFKSLFKVNIENFLEIETQAKQMEILTKKLVPAKANIEIPFEPNLNLFLHNNELKSEQELIYDLSYKYKNSSDFTFEKIDSISKEKVIRKSTDIELSSKFDYFNLFNVSKNSNKEILDLSIKTLIRKSSKLLQFDIDSIFSLKTYDESFKQILREYGDRSTYTTIVPINEIWSDSILEFDYSGKGWYVMSTFKLWRGVPLVKENRIEINEFKKDKIKYRDYLNFIRKNSHLLTTKYKEIFLDNITLKEEMEIAAELNLFNLSREKTISKLMKMIEFGINLINDEYTAKTEVVKYWIKKNPVLLYNYLEKFYSDSKFNDILEKWKIELLYSVYKNDSMSLTKNDYEFILNQIKTADFVKYNIEEKIKNISFLRSDLDKSIEILKKSIFNLDTSQIDEIEILSDLRSDIQSFKKITNFFVHIRDNNSSYQKDIKETEKFNKKLLNLKEEIMMLEKHDETLIILDDSYIDILNELEKNIKEKLSIVKEIK